jgi:predicted DNA-binding mobile mystery protein A
MSIKKIVLQQLQSQVDRAAELVRGISVPKEGWLRTTRKSLGMSGAQLARRMGITRAAISNTEKSELEGRVTIKAMRDAAEAMDCRFVYAIVPEKDIETLIRKRAREKAKAKVRKINQHMALEAQTLSGDKIEFEIERLTDELVKDIPAELWNDW